MKLVLTDNGCEWISFSTTEGVKATEDTKEVLGDDNQKSP
jgi:hypothetical protein